MQIELRKDGFYFRFTRTESDYSIVSEWFGPFPSRERMIGAIWGLYHYGWCSLTETYTDEEGTRSYTVEEAIYERFDEPDILKEEL